MKRNYKTKVNRKGKLNFFKIFLFVAFSYLSIKSGAVAGNLIYSTDSYFIKNIETNNFKKVINKTFPIIDMIYNSGNISVSITSDIKSFISSIFGFDINNPLSVLNSQSSLMYSYYNKTYLPNLALQNIEKNENDENVVRNPADEKLKEDASSVSFESDEKNEDIPPDDVVSDGKIAIYNETSQKIDINNLLKEPLKFKIDKKGPNILIYHTHTTESFLNNLKELNNKNVQNWSINPSESVVRVGEELKQNLEKTYNISTIHNGTVHDSDYNNSYAASLKTLDQYMKSYPSIKMTLDIHRDGLGTGDSKLRAVKSINGKNAAQIMFVVGSNSKLSHPNWKENLKLAIKLQQKLNEIAPGLAKPIYVSVNRYNEHVTTGSLIIEVGGDGNLMSECLESTKYLAKAINEVILGK